MFIVKMVDKATQTETIFAREYENQADAEKYYDLVKNTATVNKDGIVRPYNEELQQEELKYTDIILYLLEDDKEISKFMIG